MIEKILKKDEIISHLNVREYLNSAIILFINVFALATYCEQIGISKVSDIN